MDDVRTEFDGVRGDNYTTGEGSQVVTLAMQQVSCGILAHLAPLSTPHVQRVVPEDTAAKSGADVEASRFLAPSIQEQLKRSRSKLRAKL